MHVFIRGLYMKKFLAILLLLVASQLSAQDFKPIDFKDYTLDNGLRVILHVDRTAPTAMTYVYYNVGSKDEVKGRTGFAHFFEHLMFEGTENIKRGQIDKLVTAAGGVLNASTSFDKTDYFFKVPINQLELALWIESERMMHLVIDQTGVETQRNVVKEEMKQRYEGRPYGRLGENIFKITFQGTQYEWMPIGSVEDLNSASLDEFIDFHSQYYLPNNAVLVVGGDIDIDATRDMIEKYFGDIKRGKNPQRVTVTIPDQTEPREMEVKEAVTPLPGYIESYVTVDYRNDDAFALEFLGDVLSNGKSSRLYRRMVDEEQIAMFASSFAMPLDQSGMFAFYAIANQGATIEQLQTSIREELERVQQEGITPEEFQKVRNAKETEVTRSLTSLDSKLRDLASYAMNFDDPDIINTRLEKYMKVTPEDIQRVAQKYLKPERKNVIKYVVMDSTN